MPELDATDYPELMGRAHGVIHRAQARPYDDGYQLRAACGQIRWFFYMPLTRCKGHDWINEEQARVWGPPMCRACMKRLDTELWTW